MAENFSWLEGNRVRFISRILIVVISLLLIQAPAFAALNLELTQGVSNLMPIAVVPFAGQNNAQAPNNVSTVITNDLSNSGRFKVFDPSQITQTPHNGSEVDANYWRGKNVDNVVAGTVKSVGGDRYQVSFALVNVAKGQSQVLTTQEFTIPGSELRSLAHHISDMVYKQLTGIRGVFSTRIVYVLNQRNANGQASYVLQVADYDGYGPKSLLTSNQPIMSPAWSHNGTKVAYVSFEKNSPRIYVQNVVTGARELISDFPGVNGAPAWSPDDRRLAMALSKGAGNPKIYVMDVSSHQLKQVTTGDSIDTEPNWAPDGQSLIFTSDRGGSPQIYQINLGSNDIHRVTFSGSYNARASFSPDGKMIVMINREQGAYNIAVQDLSSGTMQVITKSGYDASPSFAPNGQLVVYESDIPQAQGVLGIVSSDGQVKLRLPAPNGSVQDPAWSPFLG